MDIIYADQFYLIKPPYIKYFCTIFLNDFYFFIILRTKLEITSLELNAIIMVYLPKSKHMFNISFILIFWFII